MGKKKFPFYLQIILSGDKKRKPEREREMMGGARERERERARDDAC